MNNSNKTNRELRKNRGDSQRLTKEIFIDRAITTHGDRYDYSKVEYINYHTNVSIICKKHGCFSQRPSLHLKGAGCPMCVHEKTGKRFSSTKDSFIKKSIEKFGDKFDYSNVMYKSSNIPVELICPKHGRILIKPGRHLRLVYGCPICGKENSHIKRRTTTEEFISKAKEVHGSKYDYSKVEDGKKQIYIRCFPDQHTAFLAYKQAKENHVKKVADEYFSKGLITEHVKDLLYKFEVFEDD